ncbi:MAG TPA: uroporphyrinogen decarboxylase family protein [Clostridia bacterium]|jgi:uroporphyrinogen decarboxylase|nr:MAG: methylcobalamin:coenzyme M methyltransferase [Firmicutes bacterium ADurb.Bin146]HOD93401.1 uroporphyrinogen decarboxylase family protein [Clostridia bacterium]HQM38899.1 uroporphyrinogen decarboxylase family protein [Clostridia bacterium]
MDINYIKDAIAHKETKKIPFLLQITRKANEKYGEKLLDDYCTKEVMQVYKKNMISRCDAIYLSIGNHALGVSAPWWSWYDSQEFYLSSDPPPYMPKTKGTGSYSDYEQYTKFLKENFGCYITVFIWGSHFEKAYFARGIENFLADMACEKEFSMNLLNTIIRKNMVMLENLITNEYIDGVLLGSDWGSQKSLLMSPVLWREMIKPGEKKEYDLIHTYKKDVWVHSCGNVRQILPDLCDMGVDVLNPIQPECMDIYEIKESFGDKLAFWGGISTQRTLPYGTVTQVRAEAEKVITRMSSKGGYIAAPAQEIQDDVPYENITALIDVLRHYGV